jgi:hydrogenase nickel incorporation protein HypA/HybF
LERVSRIVLEIGQFSGVVIDSLSFAFGVVSKGTLAEGAELEFLTPPLLLYCSQCENEYLADFEDLRCPACLGEQFEIIQGREMLVKSISGDSHAAKN